jgi:hypothetical protein
LESGSPKLCEREFPKARGSHWLTRTAVESRHHLQDPPRMSDPITPRHHEVSNPSIQLRPLKLDLEPDSTLLLLGPLDEVQVTIDN